MTLLRNMGCQENIVRVRVVVSSMGIITPKYVKTVKNALPAALVHPRQKN
jgi:hypothetical protein